MLFLYCVLFLNYVHVVPVRCTCCSRAESVAVRVGFVSELCAGLLLKLEIWEGPEGDLLFADSPFWELPDFNLPDEVKVAKHQANGEGSATSGV